MPLLSLPEVFERREYTRHYFGAGNAQVESRAAVERTEIVLLDLQRKIVACVERYCHRSLRPRLTIIDGDHVSTGREVMVKRRTLGTCRYWRAIGIEHRRIHC